MKMFATVRTDYPHPASTNYFLTREEAEESVATRVMFTAALGPDVPVPGSEWLEIEEVERPSQPCTTCGTESQQSSEEYEKYPYCRNCHYTGVAAEDKHADQLAPFKEAFPDAKVVIEHTGGGCFWLAFYWEGDHYFYTATEESELPDSWADGWGYLCRNYNDGTDTQEEWDHPDYYGTLILEGKRDDDGVLAEGFTPDEMIQAIREDRDSRALDNERSAFADRPTTKGEA